VGTNGLVVLPIGFGIMELLAMEDTEMTETIVQILMRRDGMTQDEAEEALEEAKQAVADGEDPEEVLYDYFGLEPDYIFELL